MRNTAPVDFRKSAQPDSRKSAQPNISESTTTTLSRRPKYSDLAFFEEYASFIACGPEHMLAIGKNAPTQTT